MTPKQARSKLRAVGRRRAAHDAAKEKLASDTKTVLAETSGIVSVTEAAKLVGIDRSTVYQVYRPRARGE